MLEITESCLFPVHLLVEDYKNDSQVLYNESCIRPVRLYLTVPVQIKKLNCGY